MRKKSPRPEKLKKKKRIIFGNKKNKKKHMQIRFILRGCKAIYIKKKILEGSQVLLFIAFAC